MDEDETLYTGKWLRLHRRGRWELVSRLADQEAVMLVALTDADELVLVEQPRPAFEPATTLELPAGLVDEGETPLDTARRELLEETGFRASELEEVTAGCVSAGLSTERVRIFRARGLERVGPGGGVDGEAITVHLVPLASAEREIAAWREAGGVIDVKLYAALAIARVS